MFIGVGIRRAGRECVVGVGVLEGSKERGCTQLTAYDGHPDCSRLAELNPVGNITHYNVEELHCSTYSLGLFA